MTGRIKSFSRAHGYGFIEFDGKDIFFHILDYKGQGTPSVGTTVWFETYESRKGLRAKNIREIKHGE